MKEISIIDAHENDHPAIVKLNEMAVEYTSPMDLDRLSHLALLAANGSAKDRKKFPCLLMQSL